MTFDNMAARDRSAALAGATILVVENDALVGLEVTLALQDFGRTVLGPLGSVDRTLAALEAERHLDAVLRTVPRLTKPFGSNAIERVVLQLLGTVGSGRSVEQGEPSRH